MKTREWRETVPLDIAGPSPQPNSGTKSSGRRPCRVHHGGSSQLGRNREGDNGQSQTAGTLATQRTRDP